MRLYSITTLFIVAAVQLQSPGVQAQSTNTAAAAGSTQAKSDAKPAQELDVRGADARTFVEGVKSTLTSAKKFLATVNDRLSDESVNSLKLETLKSIEDVLEKGPGISDNEKQLLKRKSDELKAAIAAIGTIKRFTEAQGLATLMERVDASLGEIKKVDLETPKITIISAEYGDLTNKVGSISKLNRFCDFKDKAITECENKPYCSLALASACDDPAPQVKNKKMRVVFRCLDADLKPILQQRSSDRTVESPSNALELLVTCSIPEDGIPAKK